MVAAAARGRPDKADVVLSALAYTSRRDTRRDFDVAGSRGNCARKRSLTRTRFFAPRGGSSVRAAAADSTFSTRRKFPARGYPFYGARRRQSRDYPPVGEILRARDSLADESGSLGHSATRGIYLRSSARRSHAVLRSRCNSRPRHARSRQHLSRVSTSTGVASRYRGLRKHGAFSAEPFL